MSFRRSLFPPPAVGIPCVTRKRENAAKTRRSDPELQSV